MIGKIMRLFNRFRRQKILNNKVADKIFSSFKSNVIAKILSHKSEKYIQEKSLLFLTLYAYLYLYYLLFKYAYKYGSKYGSMGIVYIIISIYIGVFISDKIISFIDTLEFGYLLYSIPFVMLSIYFIFKTIGYYDMDILNNRRRAIKKSLILLVLFQFMFSIYTLSFFILLLPLVLLEWYPIKSYKRILATLISLDYDTDKYEHIEDFLTELNTVSDINVKNILHNMDNIDGVDDIESNISSVIHTVVYNTDEYNKLVKIINNDIYVMILNTIRTFIES